MQTVIAVKQSDTVERAQFVPGGQSPARRKGLKLSHCILITLATLISLFYAVENFRGRQAWKNFQTELKQKGEKTELKDLLSSPLLDDQNILKAPHMAEWFIGNGGSSLRQRLSSFSQRSNANVLVEVTLASPDDKVTPGTADVVLRYNYHLAKLVPNSGDSTNNSEPTPVVIPLIQFSGVPLSTAIENLARQGNLPYVIASNAINTAPVSQPGGVLGWFNAFGYSRGSEPVVSVRWQNITAEEALVGLLETYSLAITLNPQTGTALIAPKSNPNLSLAYSSPAVQERLGELLQQALSPKTDGEPERLLNGSMGLKFIAEPLPPTRTIHVLAQADSPPSPSEVEGFIPDAAQAVFPNGWGRLRAHPVGANKFHLQLGNPPCLAADYLKWSDQFEPEFEILRTALKRPMAQFDFDCQSPLDSRHINFLTVRTFAQTLAQRAQCHLLQGQPESALQDLTLLHDMQRLLDSEPVTLVAAMINTAITGLYTDVIRDGLRLDAWRDSDLAALQKQLQEINLKPSLVASIRFERLTLPLRLNASRLLEEEACLKFIETGQLDIPTNFWQKVDKPIFWYFTLAPRGWVDQNLTASAALIQKQIDATDEPWSLFQPRKIEAANMVVAAVNLRSPYSCLMSKAVPNYVKASVTAARAQLTVNETFAACALERYRLAHGEYPESLEAIVPEFAKRPPEDVIGGKPLKYRRAADGNFVLYSVGWNETDDGGQAVLNQYGQPSMDKGDWVWQLAGN